MPPAPSHQLLEPMLTIDPLPAADHAGRHPLGAEEHVAEIGGDPLVIVVRRHVLSQPWRSSRAALLTSTAAGPSAASSASTAARRASMVAQVRPPRIAPRGPGRKARTRAFRHPPGRCRGTRPGTPWSAKARTICSRDARRAAGDGRRWRSRGWGIGRRTWGGSLAATVEYLSDGFPPAGSTSSLRRAATTGWRAAGCRSSPFRRGRARRRRSRPSSRGWRSACRRAPPSPRPGRRSPRRPGPP